MFAEYRNLILCLKFRKILIITAQTCCSLQSTCDSSVPHTLVVTTDITCFVFQAAQSWSLPSSYDSIDAQSNQLR